MSHFTVIVIGDNPEEQLAPFNEELQVEKVEEDGDEYWRNPDAKWDWYQLGGRWTGYFKLLPGKTGATGRPGLFTHPAENGTADQCRKGDIDPASVSAPFAVVKDGMWYQRGELGWWAIVSDDKGEDAWGVEFRELWDSLPDDTLVSMYDCHI